MLEGHAGASLEGSCQGHVKKHNIDTNVGALHSSALHWSRERVMTLRHEPQAQGFER